MGTNRFSSIINSLRRRRRSRSRTRKRIRFILNATSSDDGVRPRSSALKRTLLTIRRQRYASAQVGNPAVVSPDGRRAHPCSTAGSDRRERAEASPRPAKSFSFFKRAANKRCRALLERGRGYMMCQKSKMTILSEWTIPSRLTDAVAVDDSRAVR